LGNFSADFQKIALKFSKPRFKSGKYKSNFRKKYKIGIDKRKILCYNFNSFLTLLTIEGKS